MQIVDGKTEKMSEERVRFYLHRVGATELAELSFDQRKKIFLLAANDFVQGIFSSDDLSSLSSNLHLLPMDMKTDKEHELNDAIYAASELFFYIRKIDSKNERSQFDIFMFAVMSYYNTHFPF